MTPSRKAGINVTPLIDVPVVLLVIFMATIPRRSSSPETLACLTRKSSR